MYISDFVNNQGVSIHYHRVCSNQNEIPLIIIPGAINSAEEISQSLNGFFSYHHVIISLRGRGKSDSPDTGYTIDDQAGDVVAVIKQLKIKDFFLFGHSVGSSIGIRVAAQLPHQIKGLIMGDFPPFYPPFDKSWVSHVLKQRVDSITKSALYGLAKDGRYIDLVNDLVQLSCPILLIRAGQKDSAFPVEQVSSLTKRVPNCEVVTLTDSGHDLFATSADKLVEVIRHFMQHQKVEDSV